MNDLSVKKLKRLIVAVIGSTVLIIGIAMLVLPGPAIVVIPVALGILATEFAWARRALQVVRDRLKRSATNSNNNNQPKDL